jgi:hypothetical protein
MLNREDFTFTIGYDGPLAVIDGQARRRCRGLSSGELAEKGLFRAAYASALRSGERGELEAVEAAYRRAAGAAAPAGPLDRLFGVFPVNAARSVVI